MYVESYITFDVSVVYHNKSNYIPSISDFGFSKHVFSYKFVGSYFGTFWVSVRKAMAHNELNFMHTI